MRWHSLMTHEHSPWWPFVHDWLGRGRGLTEQACLTSFPQGRHQFSPVRRRCFDGKLVDSWDYATAEPKKPSFSQCKGQAYH